MHFIDFDGPGKVDHGSLMWLICNVFVIMVNCCGHALDHVFRFGAGLGM